MVDPGGAWWHGLASWLAGHTTMGLEEVVPNGGMLGYGSAIIWPRPDLGYFKIPMPKITRSW